MIYYEKELNRTFDIPEFNNINSLQFYIEYKNEIYDALYQAITIMTEDNLEYVPCMIVNDVVFSVNSSTAFSNIKFTIEHYIEIEEYEKCNKLKEIQSLYENNTNNIV